MNKNHFIPLLVLLPFLPLCAQHYAEGREFRLGAPQLEHGGPLFQDSAVVRLSLGWEGAVIRYTLDGSLPDERSAMCREPLVIWQDAHLQARAFHPSFQPSEPSGLEFVRRGQKLSVVSATLGEAPAQQYAGRGANGLVDGRKGSADFRDGEWLGFNGADAVLQLVLEDAEETREIIVSTLSDPGSWIFPPAAIEVWARAKEEGRFLKIGEAGIAPPGPGAQAGMQFFRIDIPPTAALYWEIRIRNFGLLPEWHQGKGAPAWLFIDEIVFR